MERLQSPIVPEKTAADKGKAHSGNERRANAIELGLIVLVVLFVLFVLGVLIVGSRQLIDTANTNLPK